jgi:hypothetical protein
MNKSQMRMKLGFAAIMILAVLVVIIYPLLTPHFGTKEEAQIVCTQFESKDIASALKKRVTVTGSLSTIDNAFILQAVFGTNTFLYSDRTNANGQFLDPWETPYKIDILGQTNFTVRSAGPNKKFGDADDIIFNSVSNDFSNP